jgi:phage terminase large subunit-like protein
MGARGPGAKPARATAGNPSPSTRGKNQSGRTTGFPGRTRADRVIRWLETLSITSGAHAGRKLVLRPWQREIIRAVYATDATGRRPVRTALVSMARKNGKTTLAAALALCHLVGPEAVQRGQVVSAAADREQAAITYRELRAFALANTEIADRLVFRDFNKTVEDVVTGSTFAALSADHRKAHGLSPVVAICDELAQWRGRELLDALQTGQGAHAEPLLVVISTRSPQPDNPLEELIRYAGQVQDGTVADASFASCIFSAPLDADPWTEETWRQANPGLGDFRSLEDVQRQAARAQKIPAEEAAFRAFVLNQPFDSGDDAFLRRDDWMACAAEAEPAGPCFAGLDLASGAADLTAFALYWPETGALRCWAFLPGALIGTKEQQDRAPYGEWKGRGLVVPIPGKAIDRAWLLHWIARQTEGLDLVALGSDRWGLTDLQAVADREGITLPWRPLGMGYKDMTPLLRSFEEEVIEARLAHAGNPLLTWAIANAVVDTDPAGGRKLAKDRAHGRIDPLVAAVLAVGLAKREPAPADYSFTGVLV